MAGERKFLLKYEELKIEATRRESGMVVTNDSKAIKKGKSFRERRLWEIGDKVFEELLETYEFYLGFCYPTLHHREIRERVWQELSEGKIKLKNSLSNARGKKMN